MKRKSPGSVNLTEGPVLKNILLFSLPLMAGNLLQQFYNTADSLIVGHYIGSEALAAIGANGQVINLFINLVIGLTTGAGIVIANYWGAQNQAALSRCVHTSIWLCSVCGIIISAAGFLCSPALLVMLQTPPEIMDDSVLYLRIYFSGAIFTLLYNICSSILQAVGNTLRPLYYLLTAAIINIVMNYLMIVCFHTGIWGVAFATIFSQGFSVFLFFLDLTHTSEIYHIHLKQIRPDFAMIKHILAYGLPASFQSGITAFSNVIVQKSINGFGIDAMAGHNIYNRIDAMMLLPANVLSLSTATYVSQNQGAGKTDRVKTGLKHFLITGNLYAVLVGVSLFFRTDLPMRLFTSAGPVIQWGQTAAQILGPSYFILISCQIMIGFCRGTGHSLVTMIFSVLNLCLLRILWLSVMLPVFHTPYVLYLGYTITWFTAALSLAVYYHYSCRQSGSKKRSS